MTTQHMYDDQHDADTSVVGHPYASETAETSEASQPSDGTGATETPQTDETAEVQEQLEGSAPSTPAEEIHASNAQTEEGSSSATTVEQPQDVSQQAETPANSETQAAASVEVEAAPVEEPPPAVSEEQQENQQPVAHDTASEAAQSSSEQPAPAALVEPVAVEPLLVSDTQANTPADSTSETAPADTPAAPLEAATVTEETASAVSPEEVRPFTSFFEEFRQAEEARQELQAEALSLFATAQAADYTPLLGSESRENEPQETPTEIVASAGVVDAAELTSTQELFGMVKEPAPLASDVASTADADADQQASTASTTPTIPTPPKERPISPLLRPATRLRLPRHGLIRHREEPAPLARPEPSAAQASIPQMGEMAEATNQANAGEHTVPPVEQPRPTRRYRFDNRSSVNAATSANSAQATDRAGGAAKPENGQNGSNGSNSSNSPDALKQSSTPGNDSGTSAQGAENQTQATKQPLAQDIGATEHSAGAVATPSHISEQDRRRRHGQERPREKEQSMISTAPIASVAEATSNQTGTASMASTPANPATVAEVAALVTPEQPTGEVAPEDLPPLEYSELQKANPRRRRRHRTSTNGAAATPATPAAPVTPAAQATATQPQIPAATPIAQPLKADPAPAADANNGQVLPAVTTSSAPRSLGNPQYSIVSGYTVNQMNQGNEATGPFMGPEPSPARGSVITRDGRTARAESQRSHVYPVRSGEATASSTSIHQLASVLSQAIQTQTDRMVAELRRANQGPTNVSVSLPPMPSSERVGVFVDVANLLYSARTTRVAVDFGKLLDFLRGNRRLIRAHAYCPTSPQAGDEQMFLQAVKGLGYRITTKNYKTFSSGAKKADLDLDLCMDVVRLVDGGAVDCIVLVSGDSDFMPMLDYCSDHGVRVEVAAFDEAMSATLRQSCDLFINLSMLEEIRS